MMKTVYLIAVAAWCCGSVVLAQVSQGVPEGSPPLGQAGNYDTPPQSGGVPGSMGAPSVPANPFQGPVQQPAVSMPSTGTAVGQLGTPAPQTRPMPRTEIPLPPTATPATSGLMSRGGGWVTGEGALAGGPFPGYMTGYGTVQSGGAFGGNASLVGGKPYSQFTRPEAVSPYINLYRPNSALGPAGNYFSLVRPLAQQQQFNRQTSQQLQQIRSNLTPNTGYGGRAAGGGGTGGYFMNYYGFYPNQGGR